MSLNIDRRAVLRAGVGFGLGFAGLSNDVLACEFFSRTLRITHPWTRATAQGETTAVVNMKFDQVIADDRLVLVETPVASGAEIAGVGAVPGVVDFAIPEGRETALGEGGTYVRLLGLKQALEIGRSYPLKLGFEKAGVVNATLNVDYTSFRFK